MKRAGLHESVSKFLRERQLLIMILLSLLLLLAGIIPGQLETYLFLLVGIAAAWLATDDSPKARRGILVSGAVVMLLLVASFCLPSDLRQQLRTPLGIFLLVSTIVFLVSCATAILKRLLSTKSVTSNEIYETVNLYVLMGAFWAQVYSILELLHPGSFTSAGSPSDTGERLLYFSFVTLATLGYGDITPRIPLAQNLSIIEAIVGQLYLAVVVAYLVSTYIMHGMGSGRGDS